MHGLSEEQLLLALVAIAVILIVGRGTAEIARRLGQPEVLGELIGGFLLGPSVFGALFPSAFHTLFLQEGVGLALSTLSWVGAILLLLIAGLEADLKILRLMAKPGALAAFFAIVPSIVAGTLFARYLLRTPVLNGFFLGLVLSVTGVSVAAKVLIERDSLRRGYAQVILAAGIASEVLVWPAISLVASLKEGHGATGGIRTGIFAVLFFVAMMTAGRRFTFWAMRRMADLTQVVKGQLSLVLVLTFLSAGITEALGLHALLGAFVFGVLLNEAPRSTIPLKESVQTLAVGLFAPVFFVLAGMRVDIYRLGSFSAVGTLLLLFVVATVAKVGLGTLGARLGGLNLWESPLVGIGVNLKGGSDVIVAILGVTLGLFSTRTYTMYAVVAILTVMVSPPLLAWLEQRVVPSQEEMERLNREQARSRAYLSNVERVLVPMTPQLFPAMSASVVENIAKAKQSEGEVFDITELKVAYDRYGPKQPTLAASSPVGHDRYGSKQPTLAASGPMGQDASGSVANRSVQNQSVQNQSVQNQAEESLGKAGALEGTELSKVDLTKNHAAVRNPLPAILRSAKDHNLIVIGAKPPEAGTALSFGELQDHIIDEAETDVLIAIGEEGKFASPVRRILVPINGLESSMSAADIAAYVARSHQAELVLFNVMRSKLDPLFWQDREHQRLLEAGYRILRETKFRIGRLDVQASERVQLGADPADEILAELKRQPYELLVMGAVERSGPDNRLDLSRSIESILTQVEIPVLMLITHE